MAKTSNDVIGADELLRYIREQSDFGFELQVLKLLRDAGIECEHSAFYTDSVTGKSREFDIRARATQGALKMLLAIECKNVRGNFPLLVLRTPRTVAESYEEILMSTVLNPNQGYSDYRMKKHAKVGREKPLECAYKPEAHVGRSFSQVGKPANSNQTGFVAADDDVFDKWSQCLASATEMISACYRQTRQPEFTKCRGILVVPNDMLWACDFSSDGQMHNAPKRVNSCSYYVGKRYVLNEHNNTTYSVSHIDVFTVTGLSEFIAAHLTSYEGMLELFPESTIKELEKTGTTA